MSLLSIVQCVLCPRRHVLFAPGKVCSLPRWHLPFAPGVLCSLPGCHVLLLSVCRRHVLPLLVCRSAGVTVASIVRPARIRWVSARPDGRGEGQRGGEDRCATAVDEHHPSQTDRSQVHSARPVSASAAGTSANCVGHSIPKYRMLHIAQYTAHGSRPAWLPAPCNLISPHTRWIAAPDGLTRLGARLARRLPPTTVEPSSRRTVETDAPCRGRTGARWGLFQD